MSRQSQALAALAAALVGFCVALGVAWAHEHRVAECWRAAFEDDQIPPEGRCG